MSVWNGLLKNENEARYVTFENYIPAENKIEDENDW